MINLQFNNKISWNSKILSLKIKNMCCEGLIITKQEISIYHRQIDSIKAIKLSNPSKIKKISIVHCNLRSLEGIEEYNSLVSLNIKYNNIDDSEQLLRITNKSLIQELNIQGNSIEYFSGCTYLNMRKFGFNSLYLFNNKDYSKWVHKCAKVPKMQKLNSKLLCLSKQMQHNLKKTIRNNIKQKYRLSHDQLQPQQISERDHENSLNGNDESSQRTPFREISLSNVNMIKSVRNGQGSPHQEKNKIPALVIQPIQFGLQNQIVNLPLTQPTATFASQKQKQAMPFKGRNNHVPAQIIQQDQNCFMEEDIYDFSNYTTVNRLSLLRQRPTLQNKSVLQEVYEDVNDNQILLAQAYYLKNLVRKTLRALKPRNIPRRVNF